MKKLPTTNPPITFVSKLSAFEQSREALQAFRTQTAKVLEQYDLLVASYNSALDDVKATYRENWETIGSPYGEFKITKKTDIDAELLLKLMPQAEAAVNIEYKIDRKVYEQLVRKGLIPVEVTKEIESPGSISVYGPKPA